MLRIEKKLIAITTFLIKINVIKRSPKARTLMTTRNTVLWSSPIDVDLNLFGAG